MINLILFGPPGSGKGTQADTLVERYGLLHISTGDLFRYNLKNNTPLGAEAKTYIDKGELVPDSITINMLRQKVEENPDVKGYIFDGFPRTIAQSEALDQLLESHGGAVDLLLMLDVPDAEITQRLMKRAETSGRKDDQDPEIIKNRLVVYKEETYPVFEYYLAKAVKVWGVGTLAAVQSRLSLELDRIAE
ncbi:MAG: adenylate kinase [Bacteroidota bacterium]